MKLYELISAKRNIKRVNKKYYINCPKIKIKKKYK